MVMWPNEVERLLPIETSICDMARTILEIGGGNCWDVQQNLLLVAMANELLCAHEAKNPADECLHFCAEQLKCYHLHALDAATNPHEN